MKGDTNMSKVLIYHKIEEKHIEHLKNKFTDLNFSVCTDRTEMEKQIEDTDILITFKFDKDILKKARSIKWIQALSAGVETYPMEEIKKRNIILTNGRGIHKIHMAEYAICMMIMLARNMHTMINNMNEGKWERRINQGEIYGATVGIIGLGSIGMEIAKKAKFMGMEVIGVKGSKANLEYVDRIFMPEEMSKVFKESDYIINLLPSIESTSKLIDEKYFSIMKKDACFINMGRGSTVNEDDLVKALKEGRIRAAASDVFSTEPLPEDSPLWTTDNMIITPHICGESNKYFERALPIIENNIEAFKGEGNYINLVSFEKGY